MLLVDVDPANQSILPNFTAGVLSPGAGANGNQLTAQITSGGEASRVGTTVLDETLNQPIYLVPSEGQRPRLVTQMIMQNVQVLHVGAFPLPGELTPDQLAATGPTPTPTPVPAGQTAAPVAVVRPDVVTLMVSPNDANTLGLPDL